MTPITVLPIFVRCHVTLFPGIVYVLDSTAGTAWVLLGLVGQSTITAQLLFSRTFVAAYGTTALIVSLFLATIALWWFTRAVIHWAGYSLGWWGATFPVGTPSLGTHSLGDTADVQWLYAVGTGLLCLLVAYWCVYMARSGW